MNNSIFSIEEMTKLLKPIFEMLDESVRQKAFPGGILAVCLHDRLVVHPFGKLSYEKDAAEVRYDTIYDVASLTKPIVTATSIMLLLQKKFLKLDELVGTYIPEFVSASDSHKEWRAKVTLRMLLLHDSGLPAHKHFYKKAKNRREVIKLAINEPLARQPGAKIEYSDLNFIILGEIIERVTGRSLDIFAQENIFGPLMMVDSGFNPPENLYSRIAPTEFDDKYRKKLIYGEVHDENAWAMDGVAGHAGLFSTADDIAIFSQMLLNGGTFNNVELLNSKLIKEFTKRTEIGGDARALGWDVPTNPSSSGHYFSKKSFGHTGFTGTSLWIDPEKELFIILLTNRINPSRENEMIRQIRPELHDSIIKSLGLA